MKIFKLPLTFVSLNKSNRNYTQLTLPYKKYPTKRLVSSFSLVQVLVKHLFYCIIAYNLTRYWTMNTLVDWDYLTHYWSGIYAFNRTFELNKESRMIGRFIGQFEYEGLGLFNTLLDWYLSMQSNNWVEQGEWKDRSFHWLIRVRG